MKSIHTPYVAIACTVPTYFAGANTAHGFHGLYHEIANERELSRVYIIKGGSGTGKSTLMRRVAEAAENAGYPVTRYLCGSDPDSLDCVVLDGRVAVLDGTAPHARDMTYPGATSSLVDVSRFWDTALLETRRDEILAHSTAKTACWDAAYCYLRAAASVERERDSLAERLFDREKAAAFAERLLKKFGKPGKGETGHVTLRYTRAVTMRGRVYLPTFEREAETVYTVADAMGLAGGFLRMLSEKLTAAGHDTMVSRLPVTGAVDGIYLPEKRIAVIVNGEVDGGKIINMARFLRDVEGVRGQMRLAGKVAEACMTEAEASLSRAAAEHFALEEIYREAMDFPALGRYGKKVCAEVMERLGR